MEDTPFNISISTAGFQFKYDPCRDPCADPSDEWCEKTKNYTKCREDCDNAPLNDKQWLACIHECLPPASGAPTLIPTLTIISAAIYWGPTGTIPLIDPNSNFWPFWFNTYYQNTTATDFFIPVPPNINIEVPM